MSSPDNVANIGWDSFAPRVIAVITKFISLTVLIKSPTISIASDKIYCLINT